MADQPGAPPDLHATAVQRLRIDGQRYTSNRRVLVDLLCATDHPVTIPIAEVNARPANTTLFRIRTLRPPLWRKSSRIGPRLIALACRHCRHQRRDLVVPLTYRPGDLAEIASSRR